ncbi:Mannose-6-phosphate isomerase, cupin superfamily [Chryseobacterium indologenes]|nr:Mannose-6-phosphate isomerase, cupin superfamily [Chryseobacterium indologenes]SUX52081.1 Quercetin 2,3-dioxygenase [Chryseobacterium indologenes]
MKIFKKIVFFHNGLIVSKKETIFIIQFVGKCVIKNHNMKNTIQIIHHDKGETLGIAGGNYRIIVSGDQNNDAYAVIEMLVPPGGGPLPHSHPDIQEMFFLAEGELEFTTETGKSIVKKGEFVNIPFNGGIHCFKNISDQFARMLCTVVPAGLEQVFREVGMPVKPGEFLPATPPTPERIAFLKTIDNKYGLATYPPDYLD